MNPSGWRMEEKKTSEDSATATASMLYNHSSSSPPSSPSSPFTSTPDLKSAGSYKSTHSSRSSVLERAREYNRRIDAQNTLRRRTKSLGREYHRDASSSTVQSTFSRNSHHYPAEANNAATDAAYNVNDHHGHDTDNDDPSLFGMAASIATASSSTTQGHSMNHSRSAHHQRSHSTGRVLGAAAASFGGNHGSVRTQTKMTPVLNGGNRASTRSANSHRSPLLQQQQQQQQQRYQSPQPQTTSSYKTVQSYSPVSNTSTSSPPQRRSGNNNSTPTASQYHHANHNYHHPQPQSQPQIQMQQSQQQYRSPSPGNRTHESRSHESKSLDSSRTPSQNQSHHPHPHSYHPSQSQSAHQSQSQHQSQPPLRSGGGGGGNDEAQSQPIVTPELLVEALAGHEDGLLAIAEKLMEHYDSGYDVMGEAIIDAFADVQKLFQHVVEAAHMEGAAFEASRVHDEMAELRRLAAYAQAMENGGGGGGLGADMLIMGDSHEMLMMDHDDGRTHPSPHTAASPSMPPRHDEFIDQDVKDLLTDAIRKGSLLRDGNKHTECYELYDRACQAASSSLPVDSDHRGRLQLSLARAESMTADRACAILRYAMDDVLRSGMRAVRTPLPDPSRRADVVLSKPNLLTNTNGGPTAVTQSSDEALNSLIEELKDILSAPVYANNASNPLQTVSKRFWTALAEAQKAQRKNEQGLEQQLGKLKGDFLLAKAEWEEKLNQANEKSESWKIKYDQSRESMSVRNGNGSGADSDELYNNNNSIDEAEMSAMYTLKSTPSKAGSVASFSSGLAQQAKTLVSTMNNFNCATINERTGVSTEFLEADTIYEARSRRIPKAQQTHDRGRSASAGRSASKPTRSFREYSKSPQRVDV